MTKKNVSTAVEKGAPAKKSPVAKKAAATKKAAPAKKVVGSGRLIATGLESGTSGTRARTIDRAFRPTGTFTVVRDKATGEFALKSSADKPGAPARLLRAGNFIRQFPAVEISPNKPIGVISDEKVKNLREAIRKSLEAKK